MTYVAAEDRYDHMRYNRCGGSGLVLPAVSLGLWHTFGGIDPATPLEETMGALDAAVRHRRAR